MNNALIERITELQKKYEKEGDKHITNEVIENLGDLYYASILDSGLSYSELKAERATGFKEGILIMLKIIRKEKVIFIKE